MAQTMPRFPAAVHAGYKLGMTQSARRIWGLMYRHLALYRRSWPRLLELAYWPVLNMCIWGFTASFLVPLLKLTCNSPWLFMNLSLNEHRLLFGSFPASFGAMKQSYCFQYILLHCSETCEKNPQKSAVCSLRDRFMVLFF